jgi:hypothetical protein
MSLVKVNQPLLVRPGTAKYHESYPWHERRASLDNGYPKKPNIPIGYYLLIEQGNEGQELAISDGDRVFVVHDDHAEIVPDHIFALKSEDFSGGQNEYCSFHFNLVQDQPLPFIYCFRKFHDNWWGRSGRLPVTLNGELRTVHCEESPNDRDNPTSWTYRFSI